MVSEESSTVHIGTRRSALALKQAELVASALEAAHPGLTFQIHGMATMGDRDKSSPLPNLGKGLWTSELEAKLVSGESDLIVHSLKDLPTTLPDGCVLGCVTRREDPRDVVIFKAGLPYKKLLDLPAGSVIGTSSLRRSAQLKRRYPGLNFENVRGNIETRINKLDAEDSPYSCIILAAAGLLRMDFGHRIAEFLDSASEGGAVLHAVGQGALGIEIREGDQRILDLLKPVGDLPTLLACTSERTVMRTLEGGCSVPIGVETSWTGEGESKKLRLKATVVSLDGTDAVDAEGVETVSTPEQADEFGRRIAQDLVQKGAQKILDPINQARVVTEAPTSTKTS